MGKQRTRLTAPGGRVIPGAPHNRMIALAALYGPTRLAGLGWFAGRPVAFLQGCDACEGAPRRITLTSADQPELAGLSADERAEVAAFLTAANERPQPPRAA